MPERLTQELEEARKKIEAYAREQGLDFFPVIFQLVDHEEMAEIVSYGGYGIRYPHWSFGMEYEEFKKLSSYGLLRVHELVINNNPCYAYLLKGNPQVVQKMVMAHVYGHCDFFKNNILFAHTNRKMLDKLANHASRIEAYSDKYGFDRVEKFIDSCLSIDNLIDFTLLSLNTAAIKKDKVEEATSHPNERLERPYMQRFLQPNKPKNHVKDKEEHKASREPKERIPNKERDILLFLIENAPLEDWERAVLRMIRDEAYFFAPQRMTKIMNEGWATFWHSKIMKEGGFADEGLIDYAQAHSNVIHAGAGFNPYRIGYEIFLDIEKRWNKGMFGKEWEECTDMRKKENWDLGLGLGLKKIFEVRAFHTDTTFIDEFLTKELCERLLLYTTKFDPEENAWRIESKKLEDVKKRFLFMLTNAGNPIIKVADDNFGNRKELLLVYQHEGVDLDDSYAKATLENLVKLWRRPVHLETLIDGVKVRYSHDGKTCNVAKV